MNESAMHRNLMKLGAINATESILTTAISGISLLLLFEEQEQLSSLHPRVKRDLKRGLKRLTDLPKALRGELARERWEATPLINGDNASACALEQELKKRFAEQERLDYAAKLQQGAQIANIILGQESLKPLGPEEFLILEDVKKELVLFEAIYATRSMADKFRAEVLSH